MQNYIIETYFETFVNYKYDNWAGLLLIAEFAYNNAKTANIRHTFFELNCDFYLQVSYKKKLKSQFKLKVAKKLAIKLKELTAVYNENLQHGHKFQKQYYDKYAKLESYPSSKKV